MQIYGHLGGLDRTSSCPTSIFFLPVPRSSQLTKNAQPLSREGREGRGLRNQDFAEEHRGADWCPSAGILGSTMWRGWKKMAAHIFWPCKACTFWYTLWTCSSFFIQNRSHSQVNDRSMLNVTSVGSCSGTWRNTAWMWAKRRRRPRRRKSRTLGWCWIMVVAGYGMHLLQEY